MNASLQPGKRIRILGTSGAGKTTLARQLAERLDVPHIELDALHWNPGWQMADPEEFAQRIETATAGDAWVMDGNYTGSSVRAVPWYRVDTLIFLDYSLPVILRRVIVRTFMRAATRAELWNGNRERWRDAFSRDSIILWALTTHRRRRRDFRGVLGNPDMAHLTVLHFRSPRQTARWLRQVRPAQESAPAGTRD